MDSKLTVVMATYNRKEVLARALDALAGQSVSQFEVVVVDDGSTDETWDWLEARARGPSMPKLTAVRQENSGQGKARNHGLRHVKNGLVLFMGDDIIAGNDLIERHLEAHGRAGEECAVVGHIDWCRSEIRVTPLLEMVNREGHQFGFAHMTPGADVPFTCFYTSNLSVPRMLLGDDPFDPAFEAYGWEDVELGYRLSRKGLRIMYQPTARVEHLHPMDLPSLYERQRLVGRGVHTLLRIHPELRGSQHLTPPDPPRWFRTGKRLVPAMLPVLNFIDKAGIPLSTRVLHRVLICGYYTGQEEGAVSAG